MASQDQNLLNHRIFLQPETTDTFKPYQNLLHYAKVHCAAHIIALAITTYKIDATFFLSNKDITRRGRNFRPIKEGGQDLSFIPLRDLRRHITNILDANCLFLRKDDEIGEYYDLKRGPWDQFVIDVRQCKEAKRCGGKRGCLDDQCAHLHQMINSASDVGDIQVWLKGPVVWFEVHER